MSLLGSGGPSQTATETLQKPQQYNSTDALDIMSASQYNQVKTELQVLRIDVDRILKGYIQIGTAHAELLLDQPKVWRDFLLDNVYVGNLHPDVRDDLFTFLEIVLSHNRLKGAVE